MGTNFYWADTGEHIGKRSAAGWYCWACEKRVDDHRAGCSSCGAKPETSPLEGAVGVELGFAKPKRVRPAAGVTVACRFTWAVRPDARPPHGARRVRDEYDDEMSGAEFCAMVKACVAYEGELYGVVFF